MLPLPDPRAPKTTWPAAESGSEYEYCEITTVDEPDDGLACFEMGTPSEGDVQSILDDPPTDEPDPEDQADAAIAENFAEGDVVTSPGMVAESATASSAVATTGYSYVQPPSQCANARSKPYTKRTQSCLSKTIIISIIKNRVVKGVITLTTLTYVYTDPRTSQLFNQTSIKRTSATGVSTSGVVVSGSFGCSSYCQGKSGSLPSRTLGSSAIHAIGRLAPSIPSGSKSSVINYWRFTFMKAGYTTATTSTYSLSPRCDNNAVASMGKGCVFPAANIYMHHPTTGAYYEVSRHVDKAIASGLPSTLTRTNTTQKIKNRAKACPSTVPSYPGHQCDEYPFASTNQGAASGGSARIFSGCHLSTISGSGSTGFSRCLVLTGHNGAHANALSSFYYHNRVLVGDKFYATRG
ncbi:hypothetical protein IF650_19450 [Cellulosimicrobium terreum]|nr:hypothetical protein [Cellulosimicrobium terreum]